MIYRIDVRTAAPSKPGGEAGVDPLGEALRRQIGELLAEDVGPIQSRRIFLIDVEADSAALRALPRSCSPTRSWSGPRWSIGAKVEPAGSRIEIHLKPGVMDPVAASTQMALRDMGLTVREVRTGRAWLFLNVDPRGQVAAYRQSRAGQWRDRVCSLRAVRSRSIRARPRLSISTPPRESPGTD